MSERVFFVCLDDIEKISIPARSCAKVLDLRRKLPSRGLVIDGVRYPYSQTSYTFTFNGEVLPDSTSLSSLSYPACYPTTRNPALIHARVPPHQLYTLTDQAFPSFPLQHVFPETATLRAVSTWLSRKHFLDVSSLSWEPLDASAVLSSLATTRLSFSVRNSEQIRVSLNDAIYIYYASKSTTVQDVCALLQTDPAAAGQPGHVVLFLGDLPLHPASPVAGLSSRDSPVIRAETQRRWRREQLDFLFRFPDETYQWRLLASQATVSFLRGTLARELGVLPDLVQLGRGNGEGIQLKQDERPETRFLNVCRQAIALNFVSDDNRRFELSAVALFAIVFDVKKSFVEEFGGSVWTLQFSIDEVVLDDELSLIEAGFYNGIVIHVRILARGVCRVYADRDGSRVVADVPSGENQTLAEVAAQVARDAAAVSFALAGKELPIDTPVESLDLSPRTPLDLKVTLVVVTVIQEQAEGNVKRQVNIKQTTANGILAAIAPDFRNFESILLVQNGVILEASEKPLDDLNSPFYVRLLSEKRERFQFLFVEKCEPFFFKTDQPTIKTVRRNIAARLHIPPALVLIYDRRGICHDNSTLLTRYEYRVVPAAQCFRIELRSGTRAFHTEKVVNNPEQRTPEDIISELLEFVKLPKSSPTEFSMEEAFLILTLPVPGGTCRYSFFYNEQKIGAVTASLSWQVNDLKLQLLAFLRMDDSLPGCLSLTFWDVELLGGYTLAHYQIPNGSVLNIARTDTRQLIVGPDNLYVKTGETDTIGDLKRYIARRERIRQRDFAILGNGSLLDNGTLIRTLRPFQVTRSYETIDLKFECKGEEVVVNIPTDASLLDLRKLLSAQLQAPPEAFIFTAGDLLLRDLNSRVSSFWQDFSVTVDPGRV